MFPIDHDKLNDAIKETGIIDLESATIRQIGALAENVEQRAGETMVHLEIGNPGLEAEALGVEAEIAALRNGVANKYPNISGIPSLKEAGSTFIKAFLDVEVNPKGIVPTVGSMQGSFTLFLLLAQRLPGKDTILFLNPGFPAQRNQAKLLGIKDEAFDIYAYRGEKMRDKLEEVLKKGNITALIYSNPNNPAWTNLTDVELKIIGELATKYDVIVLEDLAYIGMDYRVDYSTPYEPPFINTVAKYTDNYILLLSGSKIFSYAGQRIALVAMSEAVYNRKYPFFREFYEMPAFGDAYIFGVLYCASSGTSHSAQYALAAMLKGAADGSVKFMQNCREYARRAEVAKRIFRDNGFHIVYSKDGDEDISDGFFFTIGYEGLSGAELQHELMRYGVSAISLATTGSDQPGVRACVSLINSDEDFDRMNRFLKKFNEDHSK